MPGSDDLIDHDSHAGADGLPVAASYMLADSCRGSLLYSTTWDDPSRINTCASTHHDSARVLPRCVRIKR